MGAASWIAGVVLSLSLASPALSQPGPASRPVPLLIPGQSVAAELSPIDRQRPSGKYEDGYRIEGRRGQRLEITLSSTDLDPFLVVTGPRGYQLFNDDGEAKGGGLDSRLTIELPEDGDYRVFATSMSPGAMGAYRIDVRQAPAGAKIDRVPAARSVRLGASLDGRLEPSDKGSDGNLEDRYRLTGQRGQRVRIDLASKDFDTVLTLQAPDGSILQNDDQGEQKSTNSRIETVLAEGGDYIVGVTSFQEGEAGTYRLTLEQQPGNPRHADVRGGARVLAVAVGVSDYERISPLPNTDEDARQILGSLRRAGLLHPQSIVLTNREATKEAVHTALRRAARLAGPDDLVMFFFSGHGDQIDVPRSARELDGRAETIELYDAAMTDAELQPLIDGLDGRMVLVAIDACYSGGFRNLVSRPNVMGLFSSEEDLTSVVPTRLEAGGYLSYYLRAALAGDADNDGDRVITSGELGTYLRRRFRLEGDIPAETRGDERNFQYLLVERGGVHVDDAVVRLADGAHMAGGGIIAAGKGK